MEKTISVLALVIASAAGLGVIVKPDTSKMVSATAAENDVEVTKVQQAGGVMHDARCCKDWIDKGHGAELAWVCSDTGYDPTRIAWLDKIGAGKQCVLFDPTEDAQGNVKVRVTLQAGTPRAKPEVIAEAMQTEAMVK